MQLKLVLDPLIVFPIPRLPMKTRSMDLNRYSFAKPGKVDFGNHLIALDHLVARDEVGQPAFPQQRCNVGLEWAVGCALQIPLDHELL